MFMLRQAADWGLTAVVGRLIRHGIYINSVDSNHETALYKAVKSGHIKTARKLLAEGASPTLPDKDGNYPLHVACAQNNTAMVLLLLRSGALLEAGNLKRSTALHSAAYHGATDCIELLLKHGAKVNSKNINNHTPLEFAAAHAHLEAFSLLLENNADPTVPLSLQKFNPTQLKEAKRLLEHYSKIWRERHQVEVAQKVPLTMPARERAQAISKPKASYARRPSFFTGTIPESGQRIIFKEQFTVPDGNCGFAIFAENSSSQAVAQVRRDVSKTLLKLIDNFEDRKKLSEEILTLLLDKVLDRNTVSAPSTLMNPSFAKEAKAIAALYMVYTFTNRDELKQVVDDYCQSKRMFNYYVNAFNDGYWLCPMSACLYAREKGINLYIWRPGKEPGQLVLQQQQLSVAASKTLHMFHKPELNHFDSLGPMPEQAESKELPVVPVRAALGALRQSLAKTVISESDSGLEVTLRL